MKVLFAIGDLPEDLELILAEKGFEEDRYVDWPTDQLPKTGQKLSEDAARQLYGSEFTGYTLNVIDRLERDGGIPVVIVGVQE